MAVVWALWARVERSGSAEAKRIAAAAGRQLVLLSASDWPFLITTGTATDYATERIRGHADDLARLVGMGRCAVEGDTVPADDMEFLERVEARDDLFPEIEAAMRAAAGRVL